MNRNVSYLRPAGDVIGGTGRAKRKGAIHSHVQEQWGYLISGSAIRIQDGEDLIVKRGKNDKQNYSNSPGDFWCSPGHVEHGIIGGPDGALILDVFAPPRPEYLKAGNDIFLDFKLSEDKIFFQPFWNIFFQREVLAGVMLNVAKDDFYALAFGKGTKTFPDWPFQYLQGAHYSKPFTGLSRAHLAANPHNLGQVWQSDSASSSWVRQNSPLYRPRSACCDGGIWRLGKKLPYYPCGMSVYRWSDTILSIHPDFGVHRPFC